MNNPVWVCDGLTDIETVCAFNTAAYRKLLSEPPQNNTELRERAQKNISLYRKGNRVIESDLISDELVLERVTKPVDPPPHFFTNSYAYVSDELRCIIEKFDLGQTVFKRVVLINPFLNKRYDNFSLLNICEVKDGVDVEKSFGLQKRGHLPNYNFLPDKNDQIAVRADVQRGVDLWLDLTLFGAIFVSDKLHAALSESGIIKRPRFARCKMVTKD